MDSLLASLWPGPAPAPAPAEEEERVFSYWGDTPTEKNAAPAAPAVDIDVYDEARLAPRPVQRAGSYDTDDFHSVTRHRYITESITICWSTSAFSPS